MLAGMRFPYICMCSVPILNLVLCMTHQRVHILASIYFPYIYMFSLYLYIHNIPGLYSVLGASHRWAGAGLYVFSFNLGFACIYTQYPKLKSSLFIYISHQWVHIQIIMYFPYFRSHNYKCQHQKWGDSIRVPQQELRWPHPWITNPDSEIDSRLLTPTIYTVPLFPILMYVYVRTCNTTWGTPK